ncbi:hypothetical protein, partial [Alistipes senegalensis]|uniref:hypothetical protein n=1 Tax=Alistipes senegalensis TaxID=1288121 RepID=UPI0026744F01
VNKIFTLSCTSLYLQIPNRAGPAAPLGSNRRKDTDKRAQKQARSHFAGREYLRQQRWNENRRTQNPVAGGAAKGPDTLKVSLRHRISERKSKLARILPGEKIFGTAKDRRAQCQIYSAATTLGTKNGPRRPVLTF